MEIFFTILSDRQFPQISTTRLSILADLCNAVVSILLISNYSFPIT